MRILKNLENQLKSTTQKFENEIRDLKANLASKTEENAKLEREKKKILLMKSEN